MAETQDGARDVRAALQGLLVDEPPAPWSVADDVARGRALQRRRRTRWSAGVGLVAAATMVAVVVGPRVPWGTSVPSGTPSPGVDKAAVSALLESFGWNVDGIADARAADADGPAVSKWTVSTQPGGATASLVLRTWLPASWSEGGAPAGSVLADCDGGCGEVTWTTPDCTGPPCWSEGITTLASERSGATAGTRVLLTTSDLLRVAVEADASPVACATCSSATDPFLTDAELRQVVVLVQQQLLGGPIGVPTEEPTASTTPGPTQSATPEPTSSEQPEPTGSTIAIPQCKNDEVKVVAGEGQPSEATGARGLWVEVHARNPYVNCIVTGHPSVSLGRGSSDGVQYGQGVYQGRDFDDVYVQLSQGLGPARFAVTRYRCDTGGTAVSDLWVTLQPGAEPVRVELPSTGLEACPGMVYVSAFTR